MPKKKDKDRGPDRRTLLAAAAAGAAIPLIADVAHAQGKAGAGTRVVVDLGGVKLPDAAAKELEAEIRRAVLSSVAKAGLKANIATKPTIQPGWIGIILAPQNLIKQ